MNQFLGMMNYCVPWVAEYYDAGKPSWLIEHGRSAAVRSQIPAVLRPDLIPHADGIALTEWDSVPGGIGLTAQLESAYELSKSPGHDRVICLCTYRRDSRI